MRRRLFTILSALSLLLFAAVVVLWVRGYSGMDDVGWYTVRWPTEMNRDRISDPDLIYVGQVLVV